jgi:hypothetical protein
VKRVKNDKRCLSRVLVVLLLKNEGCRQEEKDTRKSKVDDKDGYDTGRTWISFPNRVKDVQVFIHTVLINMSRFLSDTP